MFFNQSFIDKINISNFQTQNVEDMSGMFEQCTSLEEIDLSNNDFTNIKNMGNMFYQATNLNV